MKYRISQFESLEGRRLLAGDPSLVANEGYPRAMAHFRELHGELYFAANSERLGSELWKLDVKREPTLVKDIMPLSSSANPKDFVTFGESLYFVAETPSHRRNLFRTDGTDLGTLQVSDNRNVTHLVQLEDSILFTQFWSPGPTQPYQTTIWTISEDGATPSQVVDDLPRLVAAWEVEGRAVFSSDDDETGSEIYVSNGTSSGTTKIHQFNGTRFVRYLKGQDNTDLLATFDGELTELWTFNPEYDGITKVDVLAGEVGSASVSLNSSVYFTVGAALWKSNGTEAGAELVKEFSVPPNDMVVVDSKMFFFASDETHGFELWSSDGTPIGTKIIRDILPGQTDGIPIAAEMVAYNGAVYFVANDGVAGAELWKTDGTESGTATVLDLKNGEDSSWPHALAATGDGIIFAAVDANDQFDIWQSDGTPEGTTLLADMNSVAQQSASADVKEFQGAVFALGRTDSASYLVRHSSVGSNLLALFDSSYVHGLTLTDDALYFVGNSPFTHDELWRSDGTALGTTKVAGVTPTAPSNPRGFSATGEFIYFATDQGIYRSDGTVESLKQISEDSFVQDMAAIGSHLLLFERYPTSAGTISGFNLETGKREVLLAGTTETFFHVDDEFVFVVGHSEETNNLQIWQTDGTNEGTQLLVDVPASEREVRFLRRLGFSVVDGVPYFAITLGNSGPEVWRPGENREEPTRLTTTNARFSSHFNLSELDGKLLIQYFDRFWLSDGTVEGTARFEVPGSTIAFHSLAEYDVSIVETENGIAIQARSDASTDFDQVMDFATNWRATVSFQISEFVYFYVQTNDLGVGELWRTDGTEERTEFVDTVFDDGLVYGVHMGKIGDYLYYSVPVTNDVARTREPVLKRTDGITTTSGPAGVSYYDLASFPSARTDWDLDYLGDRLFFSHSSLHGEEPWIFDSQGSRLFKDINRAISTSDFYIDSLGIGDSLLASAEYDDPVAGFHERVLAIEGTQQPYFVPELAWLENALEVNGNIYVSTWQGEIREVGHGLIAKQDAGNLGELVAVGGSLYYAKTAGKMMTVSIFDTISRQMTNSAAIPTATTNPFGAIVPGKDSVYFVANGPDDAGAEIWRFDGKTTELLTDVAGTPRDLTVVGDHVFFYVERRNAANELWVTDGTANGERLVFRPDESEFLNAKNLIAANDQLYFLNQRQASYLRQGELWTSDGTSEGTEVVASTAKLADVAILEVRADHLLISSNASPSPRTIWYLPLVETKTPSIVGDANHDGEVSFSDFLVLSDNFGKSTDAVWEDGDFNLDGVVDFADFLLLSAAFGQTR